MQKHRNSWKITVIPHPGNLHDPADEMRLKPLYVICIPAISLTARMGQQLVGAVWEEIAECKLERGPFWTPSS